MTATVLVLAFNFKETNQNTQEVKNKMNAI